MPVISPRRSSTSGSSSFYRTTPGAGSVSSSSASKPTASSAYSSYHSFLNSYSPSSYTPNTSSYRNSYISPASTYLSGGSSTLGTYRSTNSYFDANDALSSRYGLNKKPPIGDTLRRGDTTTTTSTATTITNNESDRLRKKPPTGENNSNSSKRLSGSLSSSSLAHLLATSALDIYEKYSPAFYKPNTELTRSSSRSSLIDNTEPNSNTNSNNNTSSNNDSATTTHVTLERPRSRYSRLYSNDNTTAATTSGNKFDSDTVDCVSKSGSGSRSSSIRRSNGKLYNSSSASALNQSNSSNDVPTATFTLRSNRAAAKPATTEADTSGLLRNGFGSNSNGSNGLEAQLKELKLSNSSNALNTVSTENNLVKNTNNGSSSNVTANGTGTGTGGDIEVSVTLKLNDNKSKVRSSTMRVQNAPLTSSASRYYDRGSNRNSTYSTSSAYLSSNGETDNSSSNNSATTENKEGLIGLRNIGNTCFMNSIIQCLSHTSELTKFLRQYEQSNSRAAAKDNHILNEFAKLIKDMWSGNHATATPMELKRAFSVKHRMYSDYNQQDAQEFLRFFLDSLHSALNSGVKGEPLKIDDNLSDNKKAELTWEWYSKIENSLIRDLFVGQLKSTLRCTVCGNTSVTFDPFWDLSVSLPSSSRCKLEQCLDMFIREEVLDGDEMPTCSRCKTRRKCTKSFCIQRFPKYLVIHLKRFSETRWSKLSNVVEFPIEERALNMGPYGSNPSANAHYSLYAISNHMGSTAGGHYVALCKHTQSRKWYEFNDNIVTPTDKSHLVSASAYILFYERA